MWYQGTLQLVRSLLGRPCYPIRTLSSSTSCSWTSQWKSSQTSPSKAKRSSDASPSTLPRKCPRTSPPSSSSLTTQSWGDSCSWSYSAGQSESSSPKCWCCCPWWLSCWRLWSISFGSCSENGSAGICGYPSLESTRSLRLTLSLSLSFLWS